MLKRVTLYCNTLRYLDGTQILHRLGFSLKFWMLKRLPRASRRLYQWRAGHSDWRGQPLLHLDESQLHLTDDLQAVLKRADGIVAQQFNFLNEQLDFSDGLDWSTAEVSHLCRYQLHYFDYARDLGIAYRTTHSMAYFTAFRDLVISWQEQSPCGLRDAWHPYPVSLRIVNWAYACDLFSECIERDPAFGHKIVESLRLQCAFLAGNLEFHGRGNHLLANLKALLFAGVLFEGPRPTAWVERSIRLLRAELDEQVLADGGHFERSPMYHMIVLKDLVECGYLLRRFGVGAEAETWLDGHIRAMASHADDLGLSQGHRPLLNDASDDLMPGPEDVLAAARSYLGEVSPVVSNSVWSVTLTGALHHSSSPAGPPVGASTASPSTGYYVMRAERAWCIIDCGPVCPEYLPAHAHADTLSFELWMKDLPLICDSGTYEYTQGRWRDFFRSTRAHNTVVIDEKDSSEIWASFRVARRARVTESVWIHSHAVDYFRGKHDGYSRLGSGVLHRRRLLRLGEDMWIILDEMTGSGQHIIESFLHFHPDATLEKGSGALWTVACLDTRLTISPIGHDMVRTTIGQEDPAQGWVSRNFGHKTPRTTMIGSSRRDLPHMCGFLLVSGAIRSEPELEYSLHGSEEVFEAQIDDRIWSIRVNLEADTIESEMSESR